MQTIYLDISNKGVIPTIYAKQGDVGRKFLVVFTNAGLPYNLESAMLSVWYEGDSGKGNYTQIGENSAFSISGNQVEVEMISQMLSVAGGGVLCLFLANGNQQIGSWNIPYVCEEKPGVNSEEATNYYTAFTEVIDVAKKFTVDKTLSAHGQPADAWETGKQISVERNRINNIVALPSGSTTGDAELADLRVGYNGENYPTAGEAVRDQIRELHSVIEKQYELIEDITLTEDVDSFVRNEDTNGVPYNFSAVRIRVDATAYEGASSSGQIIFRLNSADIAAMVYHQISGGITSSARTTGFIARNDGGFVDYYAINSSGGSAIEAMKTKPNGVSDLWGNVASITLAKQPETIKIPVGTRIRIWAIRG